MAVKGRSYLENDTLKLIHELKKDPTRSLRALAEVVGIGKQKCWRKKKDLEENNTIWGYTTVVDYNKLGWSTFILCLQLKPLTREAADLIIARKHEADIAEEGIIVLDFMITIGKYDGIIVFAAPDLVHAKRYYDTIRHLYADIIVTKPSMMQTMFTPILGGRVNPEMDRIHELVPPMLEGKTRDTNR